MTVQVEHLSLRLGAFALEDVGFALNGGETLVILGPSGAGKSTLLETLAGFYRPDCGRICIDGRDVTGALPEARRIGFMFQDYALFPHLTVAQNVQFGMRRADAERTRALLSRFGLSQLAQRKPHQLSGGEQQRTALARALALDPALFLFDEPLSALDAPTRDALRDELKRLLHELAVPSVYVTHDQAEALVFADQMAVMHQGHFVQIGRPSQIFNTPSNEFVAHFVGVETVLEGRVQAATAGILEIALGGKVLCAWDSGKARAGEAVLACIRPEDVALSRAVHEGSSVRNQFPARVTGVAPLGRLFRVSLDAGFPLVAYVTQPSFFELGLALGTPVVASVKATAVHLISQ